MSQWVLFVVGCTVFVTIVTAAFLLGVAQFMRWEHDDEELSTMHVEALQEEVHR